MSSPLRSNDPAYWMLEKGIEEQERIASGELQDTKASWVTKTHDSIYKASCYICRDPEFALMGLPVCKPCPVCGAHAAADEEDCDNGHSLYEYYMENKENND